MMREMSAQHPGTLAQQQVLDISAIDDDSGLTLLHIASMCNCTEAFEPLFAHGASSNDVSAGGDLALGLAAERECVEAVTELLLAGADPTAKNSRGHSAAVLASRAGSVHLSN